MIHFYKYQGTGNDFILIDNRKLALHLNQEQIAFLCHRKFGIGADGLMLLENSANHDFKMVYYNADGGESSMCGNGGRCICAFAQQLGIIDQKASFIAIDGSHRGQLKDDNTVVLEMSDVSNIKHFDTYALLNTGSPHYVLWSSDVANIDVLNRGRAIRQQEEFSPNGINVNFAATTPKGLEVRTYERGVEDETLSCGTGVTACAIASTKSTLGYFDIEVQTPGGILRVQFEKNSSNSAQNVLLTGPATLVFEGDILLQ